MNILTYNDIVTTIRNHKGLSKDCGLILAQKFPSISMDTLSSILSQEYQNRMKVNHLKTPYVRNQYFEQYTKAISEGASPGIIVRMAEKYDVTPCLVAKQILMKFFETNGEVDVDSSQKLNVYMRDTGLIPNMDLAYEIFLCTLYDDVYSPLAETIKQSVGQQYEIKLHKEVKSLGLAFRDEEHLRKYGYDKTPDVKLEVPVAIDGFVVNWIESKALFADENLHKDYLKNQYLSYWNRFGSGLVIYWFGFVETIVESSEKRIIIRDHLPMENVLHISNVTRSKNDF